MLKGPASAVALHETQVLRGGGEGENMPKPSVLAAEHTVLPVSVLNGRLLL